MNLEQKLLDLYANLSRAAARSQLYAMRARRDGRPGLAALFLALAESQAMQANRFLIQARGVIGTTGENESAAFDRELPELLEAMSQLEEEARAADSKALATGFRQSGEVNRNTARLHSTLAERSEDADYHVCDFCGYIAAFEPPENCPVCTAPRKRFKLIDFAG